MNVIELPTKLRGRYKLEAVDMATGKRRILADWFDNLITDNGLNLLATTSAWSTLCCVGSGNTAPANANTALVSLIASTSTTTVTTNANNGASPYIGTMTKTFRFPIGAATGNLSEIGVGVIATNLFSRALILDGGGSPTTITVLSSEALDATYQLQVYVPLVDVTGTVTINAVSYAYVMRGANATSASAWGGPSAVSGDQTGLRNCTVFNGALGAITASPGGTNASSGSIAVQAYTSGSFLIDSIVSFGLTDGNVSSGVSAALLTYGKSNNTMGQFQVSFSPALPKDASHTMTLTFRQSWNRH